MVKKIGLFVVLMAVLYLPVGVYAQDLSPAKPLTPGANLAEDINTEDVPNGSIMLLRKAETATPGYVHQRYALVDQGCGKGQIVDHYGAPVDPNDPDLRKTEQKLCRDFQFEVTDGD
jgi:hypothetical protein